MRSPSTYLCCAAIASTLGLASCGGGGGVFSSPAYLSVSISPRIVSLPMNTSIVFTGAVSNNLSLPQWSLLDASDAGSTTAAGTLTQVAGSGTTILYTAPPAPPIYANGIVTQGTVTVSATTTPPPGDKSTVKTDSVTFFITAPTVSVSLSPAAVTIPLGTSIQFAGYEVGSANNALSWETGTSPSTSVVGGSASYGIITTGSTGGLYTAPATMPMTGSTVAITLVSQADTTKTQTAIVTLQ
jgi:hypothetical protein